MSEPNGRISVSEDRLKALLAEFKLELVRELQQYATAAALAAVDLRLSAVERWQASQAGAQQTQQLISGRNLAWAALFVAVIGSIATVIWLKHG